MGVGSKERHGGARPYPSPGSRLLLSSKASAEIQPPVTAVGRCVDPTLESRGARPICNIIFWA